MRRRMRARCSVSRVAAQGCDAHVSRGRKFFRVRLVHPNVYTLCLHQLQFYLSIGTESFQLCFRFLFEVDMLDMLEFLPGLRELFLGVDQNIIHGVGSRTCGDIGRLERLAVDSDVLDQVVVVHLHPELGHIWRVVAKPTAILLRHETRVPVLEHVHVGGLVRFFQDVP